MKTIILMLAILLAGTALAQTPLDTGLSWVPPTEYTDGTPIESGDIASYTLRCGTVQGTDSITGTVAASATTLTRDQLLTSYAMQLDVPYFCALTATTANGETSEKSDEVHFVMASPPPPLVPNPPTLTAQ